MSLATDTLKICAAMLVGGCSTTTLPTVDRNHPAITSAPESKARPLQPMLEADEATKRTRDLIAQRAAEAKAAENEPPGNEATIAPENNQPTGHDHHH